MAANNSRTVDQVRHDIEVEREQLAGAADSLREEISEATDITGKLRANLPVVAVGALGVGFLLAGGIGATARLIFRRGRDGPLSPGALAACIFRKAGRRRELAEHGACRERGSFVADLSRINRC